MVTRIIRLRLALLFSPFRRSFTNTIKSLALLALASGTAVFLAWVPLLLSNSNIDARENYDVVVSSGILLVAVAAPFFANHLSLNIRQFGQFPVSPRKLAGELLITSVVSWSFLWVALWATAFVYLRRELFETRWLSLLPVLLFIVAAVVFARVFAGISQLLFDSARASEVRNAIGIILLVAVLPLVFFLLSPGVSNVGIDSINDAASVLTWTPFGAPIAAAHSLLNLETVPAIIFICLEVATIAILVGIWYSVAILALLTPGHGGSQDLVQRRTGWFERVPAKPSMIIGARAMTYWGRDPRYRVSLIVIPIIPLLVMGVLFVGGLRGDALAMIPVPLMLLMLAWMVHNDIATDSTAFWIHVASGVRGWQDRAGRLFPIMLTALPILLIGTSVSVSIIGDWRILPSVFALNLVALFAASATSSITSAILPYPTTRPGDSPFVQPQWHGAGAGFAQSTAFIGAVVLTIPVLWFVIEGVFNPTATTQLSLLGFSALYGVVILILGIWIGGKIFDRRAPELLALTQMFD